MESYKILNNVDELAEGKTIQVQAGKKTLAVSKFEGEIGVLENSCPHMGGPLGEGTIDGGFLKCPWHGYEFHPCTGKAPEGFDDIVQSYQAEIKSDGVYVTLENNQAHETTIADVMIETMVNWGVDTVFGMVGHSNLGLADAMRLQEEKGNLNYYGIRHEGAAAFAASAYGKLTGRPAACLTIAGPGATNLYTGMWDAKVDNSPLLALTGQIATQVFGTGNFQEVDLVEAFDSVAVFNHRVQADSPHAELMGLAIKSAILGKSVSHITFPDEVQVLPANDSVASTAENRMPNLRVSPPKEVVSKSIELIKNAKTPIIVIGHGAKNAHNEILALAKLIGAPVMTTFKAKGQISDQHPLACGVLGKSGTPISAHFIGKTDLVIVFGASFSRHTGIADHVTTIQVDHNPLALAKFHSIEVQVLGDVGVSASELYDGLKQHSFNLDPTEEIAEKWAKWKIVKAERAAEKSEQITPASVFVEMNKYAPEEAVMCVDVGNNAYSFGRYFESKKHQFLLSGYLGSIGFALPASIGAWAATKGELPIVAVAGDGGFGQYMAELTTLVHYKIPVKMIVLNNNQLAKISKEQRSGHFDVWQTSLSNPKFSDYAISCGMVGLYVNEQGDLEAKMKELFESEGPALLEIMTDPDKM
jgi:pyruvate oxidase